MPMVGSRSEWFKTRLNLCPSQPVLSTGQTDTLLNVPMSDRFTVECPSMDSHIAKVTKKRLEEAKRNLTKIERLMKPIN
jgi:hypothetical protein